MKEPLVFVSYSHDSPDHKSWVLKLSSDLRAMGVNVLLDQWDLVYGQDLGTFMHQGVISADRVLLICTGKYVAKANAGTGGVAYESQIITGQIVEQVGTKKFIPLVRNNKAAVMPHFLGKRLYISFEDDAEYSAKLESLARELHGLGALKPALGPNPFLDSRAPGTVPIRAANSSRGVNSPWFESQAAVAIRGRHALGFNGHMEIRFAIASGIKKSHADLLDAVRNARMAGVGWPIGVLLENRRGCGPRPVNDGIVAEVSIAESGLSGDPSYDYWSLRSNGDFYLLQNLPEDPASADRIWFDLRIARIAEALLFASKLYRALGASNTEELTIRVSHSGFANRVLRSADPSRSMRHRQASENSTVSDLTTTVGDARQNVAENVKTLLDPFFILFDFLSVTPAIYREIVEIFLARHDR